jgi:hypothetical protein
MTLAMTNQLVSTVEHNYPVETEIFCLLKSLSNKSKKPSEMTAMSANDFYDCQFPAKKLNFPLIPFCSLRTFHQSGQLNTHYKKSFPEPATKDNRKNTPKCINKHKVISLDEILPDITLIKNRKRNVSKIRKVIFGLCSHTCRKLTKNFGDTVLK